MMNRFTFAIVIGFSLANAAAEKPKTNQKIDAFVEDALLWMPEDTELVSCARGPFPVPGKMGFGEESFATGLERISLLPFYLNEELPKLLETIREAKVLVAVEGARRFRAPIDIGICPYEGCHALLFDGKLDGFLKAAKEMASGEKKVEGSDVFVFDVMAMQTPWKLFMAAPQPDVLLVATDQKVIETVLSRIAKRPAKRALPKELAEWKHIDKSKRFWSLRHFSKKGAEEDPTSPLVEGSPHSDAEAIGLAFSYDGKGKRARVHYLSTNEKVEEVLEYWKMPEDGFDPEVKKGKEQGVTEIIVDLEPEGSAEMFQFLLMGALGHMVAM